MQLHNIGLAVVVFGLLPLATSQEPDWQLHSKWCASDGGSSGATYRIACAQGLDQFDSVLSCQRDAHNDGAVAAVTAAGRQAVNDYMSDKKPSVCR